MPFKKILAALFMSLSLPVWASVPYTFTNGQPADATQLNANFSTLVSQIAQLQAQLAALQPVSASTSIVGTWDFVGVDVYVQSPMANNYSVEESSSKGSLTFNANLTLTGSSNWSGGNLSFVNQVSSYSNSGAGVNFGPYSYINATLTSPDSGTDPISGTYTISGSTVTITIPSQGNLTGTISADGKILILCNHSGSDGVVIGLKR